MHPNERKFLDICCEVRQKWGLKTSTFEQLSGLIGQALSASVKPGVDDENAELHLTMLRDEWTRWRATGFLLQERKQVAATLSRWPRGRHYYVSFVGDGLNIRGKFNTQAEAQQFYDKEVRRLKREGRTIIDSQHAA